MRRSYYVKTFLVVLSFCFLPLAVSGGELVSPKGNQGYYLSMSPTFSTVFVESKKNYGPWLSYGGEFRLGEALNRRFDLGLTGGIQVARGDDYQTVNGNFGLEGVYKPTQRLFVRLQAGLGFADFTRQKSGMDKIIGTFGGLYKITAGYEFFPYVKKKYKSGGLSISPQIGATANFAEVTSVYTVFIGVAITWWSGLPKNKLDLPLDKAFE